MLPEIQELDAALDSLIAGHPERVSVCRLLELQCHLEDAAMPGEAMIAAFIADQVVAS